MSRPPLPIGTRLVLREPAPDVLPPVEGHSANPYDSGYRACTECATCLGIPAGSPFPWNTASVVAFDEFAGQDGELVLAPLTFSNVSGPRRLNVDDALDLFDVESEGTAADGWTTPIEELVA